MRSCAEDNAITIVIVNPRQEIGLEEDDVMSRRDGLRIWKIFEKDSVEFRPWCWGFGDRPGSWEIEIGPRDVLNVGGIVSILWYERLLWIVSLLVSKNWSQEVNKTFVSEQQSSPLFCISLYLHLYMYCYYWHHYGCVYTTVWYRSIWFGLI